MVRDARILRASATIIDELSRLHPERRLPVLLAGCLLAGMDDVVVFRTLYSR